MPDKMKDRLRQLVETYIEEAEEHEDPKTLRDMRVTERIRDFVTFINQTELNQE